MTANDQGQQPTRTRRRSALGTVGLGLCALLILVLMPVSTIYAPLPDAPEPVDVVMVLGPPEPTRIQTALALIEEGYSENLVISASNSAGPNGIWENPLCTKPQPFTVHCEQSAPFTTQGEVGLLNALAQENGWDSAIFITFTPHVSRTRLYVERCFDGDAHVISDGATLAVDRALFHYFYQLGGFLKASMITPGCVDATDSR